MKYSPLALYKLMKIKKAYDDWPGYVIINYYNIKSFAAFGSFTKKNLLNRRLRKLKCHLKLN